MRITAGQLKTFGIGLAVTVVATLGAALLNLGPTMDIATWARNLVFAEAGAVGAYIVLQMQPYIAKDEEE
jgi:hypothetical protein